MKKNYILIILISLLVLSPKLYAQVEGCEIIIIKEADPADNTAFVFDVSGAGMFSFTLSDPANKSEGFFVGKGQSADLIEMVPEGWELVDIECTSDVEIMIEPIENGRKFTCLVDFDETRCTFRNEGPPPAVPTLSEWGLIAMAGVLGIVGFMVI